MQNTYYDDEKKPTHFLVPLAKTQRGSLIISKIYYKLTGSNTDEKKVDRFDTNLGKSILINIRKNKISMSDIAIIKIPLTHDE